MLSKLVALDIDGVILKGKHVIKNAIKAINLLQTNKIPFIFVSNGGGITEASKAYDLTNKLGIPIRESQIVLSHTPLKELKSQYQNSNVLIIGSHPNCTLVAKSYGYNKAFSIDSIIHDNPYVYPLSSNLTTFIPNTTTTNNNTNSSTTIQLSSLVSSIEAVMIFHDPVNWGLEMQILSDVLTHSNHHHHHQQQQQQVHNKNNNNNKDNMLNNHSPIPIYVTNGDLAYNTEYPLPRFTQGAFIESFTHLYELYHQKPLQLIHYGKPYPIQYRYVEKVLLEEEEQQQQATYLHSSNSKANHNSVENTQLVHNNTTIKNTHITTNTTTTSNSINKRMFFGVGDNPLSDIKGATNAGLAWHSILVRTGLFSNDPIIENDVNHPANYVCNDVYDAVQYIIDYK